MQLAQARHYVELCLLGLSLAGNTFLWFVANLATGISPDFFGLFISSFVLVLAATPAIPDQYKVTARTLSFFFLWNFEERALCSAKFVFNEGNDAKSLYGLNDDQIRLLRCGMFFVLFATFAIFVERMIIPPTKALSESISLRTVKSVRGLAFLVAAVMLVISQCVTWGIKDQCSRTAPQNINAVSFNVSALVIAALLVVGVALGDREFLDLGVFFSVMSFDTFRTIFNTQAGTTYTQDSYPDLWRAQIAFGFIAIAIVTLAQVQHSIREGRSDVDKEGGVIERIKSPRFGLLCFLTLLAFAGAICVYVRVPPPDQERRAYFTEAVAAWWATFGGFVVPLLCLIAWLTSSTGVALIASIMSLHVLASFAMGLDAAAPYTATGYLRAGMILHMLVCFAMPLLVLGKRVALADNPEVYFEGSNKTPMSICLLLVACALLWWDFTPASGSINLRAPYINFPSATRSLWPITLFIAVLFFFAASLGDSSMYKLVQYVLLALLTAPGLWPVSHDQFDATPTSVLFIVVGWSAVAFVVFIFPGVPFDCFHGVDAYEMVEQQKAFIEPDAAPAKALDTDDTSIGRENSMARAYLGPNNSGTKGGSAIVEESP
jgi:hypothetical protein